MAGNLEVVKLLVENGADTNHQNSMGYTPLLYCFSRMTETTNVYENKNICLSIAEILLQYGADINYYHHGKTLLMSFCGISMALDPVQLEMNLEVITFLLENGADRTLKAKTNSMTSEELANNHCSKETVKELLRTVKQTKFHQQASKGKRREGAGSIILDDTKVKVGCCSLFYFCRGGN